MTDVSFRRGRGSAPQRVVIAGGGVAAVECMLALRASAGDQVSLIMLCPDEFLELRPLSVAEPFEGPLPRRHPLDRICAEAGATLVSDSLRLVDDGTRVVFTAGGRRLPYDTLVVAVGAPRRPVLDHAHTFFGDESSEAMHGFVRDVELGYRRRIAFVAPPRAGWTLPLYELALQTATRAHSMGVQPSLTLVTAEDEVLEPFRGAASAAVAQRLAAAGVEVVTRAAATGYDGTQVAFADGRPPLAADAVIALPAQRGPIVHGLRSDLHGFLPVDGFGRVAGHTSVYGAGDATDYGVKAGGVATQHADTVAMAIAADAGVDIRPEPFRPVLRAKLLTGDRPLFLQASLVGGMTVTSQASSDCPWEADEKLYGTYLTPYLARDRAERRWSSEYALSSSAGEPAAL